LACLGFAVLAGTASGTTYIVTNIQDAGPGSLRDAIAQANSHMGPDMVIFQAGLTGSIGLTSGELSVIDDVMITGPGANILTVSANNRSRVFNFNKGRSSLSGLTVTGGVNSESHGAGIYVAMYAALTVTNSMISGNTEAANGVGGGIANDGVLSLSNSTISGN